MPQFTTIARKKGKDGGHNRAWNTTLAPVRSDARILLDESRIEVEDPPSYFDKTPVVATNPASGGNKRGFHVSRELAVAWQNCRPAWNWKARQMNVLGRTFRLPVHAQIA
jgi:hypothetical protein